MLSINEVIEILNNRPYPQKLMAEFQRERQTPSEWLRAFFKRLEAPAQAAKPNQVERDDVDDGTPGYELDDLQLRDRILMYVHRHPEYKNELPNGRPGSEDILREMFSTMRRQYGAEQKDDFFTSKTRSTAEWLLKELRRLERDKAA